jgi:outer membrane protein assembly factor BamB
VVSTDVPCARVSGTALTSGTLGEIERIPPASTTTNCATGGAIGSVVLVPNGDDGALVGFKVVAGLDGQPVDQCAPDDAGSYGSRCIVSRRALRYLPHTPLTVQVRLSGACAGIACDPESTCVEGSCVPALIANPSACVGDGCSEGVLSDGGGAPGDASMLDGSPVDATVSDSSLSDAPAEASPPVDARVDAEVDGAAGDASVGDGAVPGCDLGGLQPGAAWPMGGYCPARRGRSPLAAPTTKPTKMWRYPASDSLPGTVLAGPTVGADGTIYVATGGNHVVAVSPSGSLLWDQSIPADQNGFVTEPVLARDGTIRLMVDSLSGDYAIFPLDGGAPVTHALQVPGSGPISSAGGLTIVTGDTMYVCDTDTNLSSLSPSGSMNWHVGSVSDENIRPAVDPTTSTIFVGDSTGTVTGVAADGGVAWVAKVDAGAGADVRGLAVAADGTVRAHTYYGAKAVFSFDPTAKGAGAVRWQQMMSDAVNGLAVDDQGTAFVSTGQGIVALSAAAGAVTGTYAGGACGPPIVDAANNVLAWCSGNIVALTPDLATTLWVYPVPETASVNDTPVIGAQNVVYFTATGGTLADGGADNFLVALKP